MPYIGHAPTNAGTFYVIDDLTMSSSTTYTLQVGGVSVTPRVDSLLITLDGVIQHTPDAYTISGSTLTFASAPGSGVDFYGIIMGQSASTGQGSIGADELKVTGDGSANQFLAGDGDGTFTFKDGTLSTTTTTGDIIYRANSSALARLGIGSTGQVLTVASGVPAWSTDTEAYLPSAGGTMSGNIAMGGGDISGGGTITGTFVGGITGNVTGNASGSSGSTTGNAATATALATARAINGVDFDGSAAITVTAAAGTLSGTELKSTVVTSSLTSVGTLGSMLSSGEVKTTRANNWGFVHSDGTREVATYIATSGGDGIGTKSAHDFNLIVGGATKATLDTSGNFGIGATSISSRATAMDDTGPVLELYDVDNDSALQLTSDSGGRGLDLWNDHTGANVYFDSRYDASNTSGGEIRFRTRTSDETLTAMTIRQDANVGIGETSPSVPLEIYKSGNGWKQYTSNGTVNVGTYLDTTTGWFGTKSNHGLRLGTNDAERMILDTSGNVTICTGNLVIDTAGKGIDFSRTSDASGMTSELLDDYEEGTWTPAVVGGDTAGTWTAQSANSGVYTKIGRTVILGFSIHGYLTGASGTYARFNLPWTAVNSGYSTNIYYGYTSNSNVNTIWDGGYVGANSNSMYLTYKSASGTGVGYHGPGSFTNSVHFIGTIVMTTTL